MSESEVDAAVVEIVERAQLLGPRERAAYLRHACGADETLLSRVLIALGDSPAPADSWADLEGGAPDESGEEEPAVPLEGQRLGPYRIVRRLGSGGMGDVYLAERADDEYTHQVAIKLVRGGAVSSQVRVRLRTERQILASLQHPNIARLLDGGRTPDGTPYLVMEYIDGEPIDVYCDRRRLPLEERVKLLRIVCSAVQYAHQNLIVHRDLKPSNILITPEGSPKLLDFGIAKLLDTRHSPHTLAVTHYEYRVMTPAHASPEQIRGDTITTASDIYVLGVLAYELLTGRKPFQLIGSSLVDLERIICEQTPIAPSAMVTSTGQESPGLLADIAAARTTTPARLQKQLTGDIDNIILMAMRKDASRRYSSAEQLSADFGRHMEGQPVLATGDSWLYRTSKFVSRHAVAVAASVAAVLTLGAFAAITFVQAQRIAEERDVAAAERTRAEQVSSFLVELFELSDPSRSRGNQVTARELLDIGARRVSTGLADQPETRASLLATIGRVYSSLGLYTDSIALLEDALQSRIALHGPHHAEVAAALLALGEALCERGELDDCEGRLDAALRMQQELAGPESVEIAPILMTQARLAQQRGELELAEERYNQSLEIYRQHERGRTPEAASVMNELAGLYSYRSEYDRAATLYRTALDIDRQVLGQDHPSTVMHLHNLALALHLQGRIADAEPLYAESTAMLQRLLGNRHPYTLDALANYGRFLHRKGDLAQAERVFSDVLAADRDARGPDHAYVGHDLVNRAILLLDLRRYEDAEADLRAALDIYARALPDDHPYVASALAGLGRWELEQGNAARAEELLRQAIDMAARSIPQDSPQLAVAKSSLGNALIALERFDEAAPLLRDSYPILVRAHGEQAVITRNARTALAQLDTRDH